MRGLYILVIQKILSATLHILKAKFKHITIRSELTTRLYNMIKDNTVLFN
jgi:hypothetical protein